MHVIQCYRKKSKFENAVLSYVENNPAPGEHVQFTEKAYFAHKFDKLNVCKNVRDDALQFASKVTIVNI